MDFELRLCCREGLLRSSLTAAAAALAVISVVLDFSFVNFFAATFALLLLAFALPYRARAADWAAICFLYLPLSALLSKAVAPPLSYVVCATLVISIGESLDLANVISKFTEGGTGVDQESKALASRLVRSHNRRIAWMWVLVFILVAGAGVLSGFTFPVAILMFSVVLLIGGLLLYSRL